MMNPYTRYDMRRDTITPASQARAVAERKWPPLLPFRVRLMKLLCPRGYGVVKECGWEDIRV